MSQGRRLASPILHPLRVEQSPDLEFMFEYRVELLSSHRSVASIFFFTRFLFYHADAPLGTRKKKIDTESRCVLID